MVKSVSGISPFVVERLTRYYLFLQMQRENSTAWISSQSIATALGLTSSTVRQDISHLASACGISKKGYPLEKLTETLRQVLGTETPCRAIIVGAGNFGRALLLHKEFRSQGFHITGIFDNNPELVGRKAGHCVIQGMSSLKDFVGEQKICIGIIAVPAFAAQQVADELVASGVPGVLNLSTKDIQVPPKTAIVNSRLILDLMQLSFKITYGRAKNRLPVFAKQGR